MVRDGIYRDLGRTKVLHVSFIQLICICKVYSLLDGLSGGFQ